jgi:phosphoglycerate kinase
MIHSIRDLDLLGKKVFIRVDFNVPVEIDDATKKSRVTDATRIEEALPTIRLAIESGAKIILASHFGRPKGKKTEKYSLMPAAEKLAELLDRDVTLADDCIGEGIELRAQQLKNGEILVLENLRFYPGEEADDLDFAKSLARLADVYINDAFGASHRKHASLHKLPSLMPIRGMGLLMEKEVRYLSTLLDHPKIPFFLILGGAKVSDKIKTISALLQRVQGIVIGGAMAYAFMKAKGESISPEWKQPAPEDVDAAKTTLKYALDRGVPIHLPVDTNDGFDIGPKTIEAFKAVLAPAAMIFWNGPLGWFEREPYSKGTFQIAEALSKTHALKVVGGGDTVSAIHASGLSAHFDHLSTGGGASLEFLEGNSLPGIDALQVQKRAENPRIVPNPKSESGTT